MRSLLTTCVLLLLPLGASAQQEARPAATAWPSVHLGLLMVGSEAGTADDAFLGLAAGMMLRRGGLDAAFRLGYAEEFRILDGDLPDETVWTAAALVGRTLLGDEWLLLHGRAGASLTGGRLRTGEVLRPGRCDHDTWFCGAPDTYRSTTAVRPGLTGELLALWNALPVLGLGATVQGTANRGRSHLAYGLSLYVGRLR